MDKLILFTSCIVAVIADMLMVWWAKKAEHPVYAIVLGMILLNVAGLAWMLSMKRGIESATAITVYSLFTVVGCSFLGFVIFHEPLSFINFIGIGLALIALILISL